MRRTQRRLDVESPRVRFVCHEGARQVVTIGPDHNFWSMNSHLLDKPPLYEHRAPIVRLMPPVDASDEQIAEVARRLREEFKCPAVRVLPRAKADRPIRGEGKRERAKRDVTDQTIRQVAMVVVERITADRESVRKIVDMALTKAGL